MDETQIAETYHGKDNETTIAQLRWATVWPK